MKFAIFTCALGLPNDDALRFQELFLVVLFDYIFILNLFCPRVSYLWMNILICSLKSTPTRCLGNLESRATSFQKENKKLEREKKKYKVIDMQMSCIGIYQMTPIHQLLFCRLNNSMN